MNMLAHTESQKNKPTPGCFFRVLPAQILWLKTGKMQAARTAGDSVRDAAASVTIRAKLGEEAPAMRLRIPPLSVFVQCCSYGRCK